MCRDRILRPSDDSSFTYTFINIERISIKGLTSWFFCVILKTSSRLSAAAVRTFSVSLKLPCFARLRDKGVVADILVLFFALSFSASSFPFSSVLERYAFLIRFSFCLPNGYYRKHRNFFKKGKILLFPIAISFFLCYNTIVMIRWAEKTSYTGH